MPRTEGAEVLTYAMTAGNPVITPPGAFLFIVSATAAVDIVGDRPASPLILSGVTAGFKYGPLKRGREFQSLRITSAVNQTIKILIGDEDVNITSVVSVSGGVTTTEAPSSNINATADTVIAAGATNNTLIPANASRRRVWVGNLSSSPGNLRVRDGGVAQGGMELQPGLYEKFETTAALDLFNPSGVNAITVYVWEET